MFEAGDGNFGQQVRDLKNDLHEVLGRLGEITRSISSASKVSRDSVQDTEVSSSAFDTIIENINVIILSKIYSVLYNCTCCVIHLSAYFNYLCI